MIVTDVAVESLVPYARNPRNNTAAIDAVKASIAEFGFRQPIVVDEKMVVIVGHTRLEAAKQLGLKSVPVHVAEGLTPAQAKAYRIMDNRSHENAEWDDELLRLEFGDLKLDDFDLALTGFVSEELDKLLGAEQIEGLTDPDEAPEVPAQAVSKPGDLWILGDHRVLCGDSTVMTDVEKLMGGQLADVAFCDSPYNVDYGNSAKDTRSGNTIDVVTASSARIVVNADSIDLATTGVGAGTYRSVTVDTYGRVTAGSNPTTLAGYGTLSSARRTIDGRISNGTRGLTAGGWTNSSSATNRIDYWTFATTGNATQFGSLTSSRERPVGGSSNTRGVFGSNGATPLDYVTIATTGNATSFGTITSQLWRMSCSNGSRVLWTPSMTSPSTAMLYVNIATTGNAQSFGSVPAARYYANPATGFFGV